MKNLLLILAITFVGFTNAQSDDLVSADAKEMKPLIVDYVDAPNGKAAVMCIIGYVFFQDKEGNLIEIMKTAEGPVAYQFMQPVRCSDYINRKEKLGGYNALLTP